MQIGLFEIEHDVIIPDQVAVRILPWMRKIKEQFPDSYMQIYAYLFYMSCWDGRNVYLNVIEEEREDVIKGDLFIDFDLDTPIITDALERCKKLYETPMVKAMRGAKNQLGRVAEYLTTAIPTSGKNGNYEAIAKFMEKLPQWQDMYEKVQIKLRDEQAKVRGGKSIAFDQMDQLQ